MKKIVSVILGLTALLSGLWFFWPASVAKVELAAASAEMAEPMPPAAAGNTAPDHTPTITVTERVPEPIAESFKLMASAYASELEYPGYSRPLTPDDSHLLHPNNYVPQQVPLEGGASAAIVLPKYRFSYPETIPVSLQISGLTAHSVSIQLHSEQNNKLLATEAMQNNAGQGYSQSSDQNWQAELEPEDNWDGSLQVSVTFSADGREQTLKTGFVYSHPVATITGVGSSRGVGSDMLIPVKLNVEQAGYYRLRANLFTEKRQPLAILTSTEKLSEGETELTLRAYKAVLRQQEGPYILSSFVLERRPAVPGELTRYGDSEQSEYPLEFFSLSQLSDEPFQASAEERQRLQFLQQMAEQ
ncbi:MULTISPECIES: hypothetical protein [unclassified Arsukibacterium]|uniref:hypothetical protein n=1 Tax=unclassified Arsukibacterium TaxID=2635278 RepID=UPI000C38DAB0|nr:MULTISPECIES: hypothetical protein [unclassified Arsukibacterium]MAA96621.1 hypothetical protein [Rheinheimera sp.]MBM33096.1 hypothetical protein [Rheinheimera sp.]HAW92041.1 hypothetical protein [Candidatus Azambacteria bacterium]